MYVPQGNSFARYPHLLLFESQYAKLGNSTRVLKGHDIK